MEAFQAGSTVLKASGAQDGVQDDQDHDAVVEPGRLDEISEPLPAALPIIEEPGDAPQLVVRGRLLGHDVPLQHAVRTKVLRRLATEPRL